MVANTTSLYELLKNNVVMKEKVHENGTKVAQTP
jgi:hypothetical protein